MTPLMRMVRRGLSTTFGTIVSTQSMQGQWVKPNIQVTANNIFVGSAGEHGEFFDTKISRSTGIQSRTTLGIYETDDHNISGGIELPSGKQIRIFSRHGVVSNLYQCISNSVDDNDWGAVTTIPTSGNATYAQLILVGSRLFVLYRVSDVGSGHWVIRHTDNEGTSWSPEVNLTTIPYLITTLIGSVLHVVMYEHPVTGVNHDIFSFRINCLTGDVTDDNAVLLGNVITDTGLPVTQAEAHKLVDVTGSVSTRLFELGYDGVSVAAMEFVDNYDGTYYRYTNGSATGLATKLAICPSGPVFYDPSYFASFCFKEDDVNTVYAARNVGSSIGLGNYVIEKYDLTSGVAVKVSTICRSTSILCRLQHKDGKLWFSRVTSYPTFKTFRATLLYTEET